ncbi:MAG: hypothetical protein ACOYXA_18725 [Bacteroidota bacterium]
MIFLLLISWLWATQPDIPYKSNDEFALEVKLELRPKPIDRYTVDYTETVDQRNRKLGGDLPYLIVKIKYKKLADNEVRVKGYNNARHMICNKKAEPDLEVKLNLGFTDDLKDRVSPHEFMIYTLDDRKKEVAQIHMVVQEDGTFLVNGEVRGKF